MVQMYTPSGVGTIEILDRQAEARVLGILLGRGFNLHPDVKAAKFKLCPATAYQLSPGSEETDKGKILEMPSLRMLVNSGVEVDLTSAMFQFMPAKLVVPKGSKKTISVEKLSAAGMKEFSEAYRIASEYAYHSANPLQRVTFAHQPPLLAKQRITPKELVGNLSNGLHVIFGAGGSAKTPLLQALGESSQTPATLIPYMEPDYMSIQGVGRLLDALDQEMVKGQTVLVDSFRMLLKSLPGTTAGKGFSNGFDAFATSLNDLAHRRECRVIAVLNPSEDTFTTPEIEAKALKLADGVTSIIHTTFATVDTGWRVKFFSRGVSPKRAFTSITIKG